MPMTAGTTKQIYSNVLIVKQKSTYEYIREYFYAADGITNRFQHEKKFWGKNYIMNYSNIL
jgi:hypothetical protein